MFEVIIGDPKSLNDIVKIGCWRALEVLTTLWDKSNLTFTCSPVVDVYGFDMVGYDLHIS